jgi:hypothetical protein
MGKTTDAFAVLLVLLAGVGIAMYLQDGSKSSKTEEYPVRVESENNEPQKPTALDGDSAEKQDFANYQPPIQINPPEPVGGGSCKDMENYFNKNFGRSDTQFSNAEGTILDYSGTLICPAAIITTYPTGKKTCAGYIVINQPQSTRMSWRVNDTSGDCFVSQ